MLRLVTYPSKGALTVQRSRFRSVIGNHVPRAVIDQGEDRYARLRILTFRDVEVGHVSIEGRLDGTALQIQLRIADLCGLGRPLCEQGVENLHRMHALVQARL